MAVLEVFSMQAIFMALAALIYVFAAGWLVLKMFAQSADKVINKPVVTMLQAAILSGIVFVLASVPSFVARVVNPEILPFTMPYSIVLFAACFIVFIQKLESKRSGWYQAAVALWLAAMVSAALIVAQLLLKTVFGIN
ncbi:MAG TPA: hypothetical protein VFD11_07295 [Thiopseudomonas sp.]|nr:hypothetical protein [Thiopseudomonas sp.]